eukprot:366069-Chlamydomonas_euryale.AAC.13
MRQAHQARSAAHGHGGRRCGDWVRHGSRVEGVRQGHVPVVSHFSTAHGGCRRRAGPPRPEVLLDAVVLKHVQHLVRAAAGGLIRDRPDICIRHQLLLPLLLLARQLSSRGARFRRCWAAMALGLSHTGGQAPAVSAGRAIAVVGVCQRAAAVCASPSM